MKQQTYDKISQFMKVYSLIMGIIMGFGFIFLGIIRMKGIVAILGFICFIIGLLIIPTFINEFDEYDICEITPKNPKKSA